VTIVVCGVDVTNGSAMRRSVSLIILFGKAAILAVNLKLFGLARRGTTRAVSDRLNASMVGIVAALRVVE
jgi:hypothetical protein